MGCYPANESPVIWPTYSNAVFSACLFICKSTYNHCTDCEVEKRPLSLSASALLHFSFRAGTVVGMATTIKETPIPNLAPALET